MRAFLDNLGRDLRYTGRSLVRQPLLVTAAALSIGVGGRGQRGDFRPRERPAAVGPLGAAARAARFTPDGERQPRVLPRRWRSLDESGALAGHRRYQIENEE